MSAATSPRRRGYPDIRHSDIVFASCVSFVRNLKGLPFPGRSPRKCAKVPDAVATALAAAIPGYRPKAAARGVAFGAFIGADNAKVFKLPDRRGAVVVNDHDHLQIQSYDASMDLKRLLAGAERLERELSARLEFAWHPDIGYLTSSPEDVGTGLKASSVLHLEGLHLIGELEAVVRGLEAIRMEACGVNRGGVRNAAHVFRIGNASTLGETEEEIVGAVQRAVRAVALQELNARVRLVEEMPRVMADSIGRALAILRTARLLSPAETFDLLSPMRVAATCGFLNGITVEECDDIMNSQPLNDDGPEDPDRRDREDGERADAVNERFATVTFSRKYAKYFQ